MTTETLTEEQIHIIDKVAYILRRGEVKYPVNTLCKNNRVVSPVEETYFWVNSVEKYFGYERGCPCLAIIKGSIDFSNLSLLVPFKSEPMTSRVTRKEMVGEVTRELAEKILNAIICDEVYIIRKQTIEKLDRNSTASRITESEKIGRYSNILQQELDKLKKLGTTLREHREEILNHLTNNCYLTMIGIRLKSAYHEPINTISSTDNNYIKEKYEQYKTGIERQVKQLEKEIAHLQSVSNELDNVYNTNRKILLDSHIRGKYRIASL